MIGRFGILLAASALLTACGSGGTGPVIGAVIEEVGGLLPGDERVQERRNPPKPITRQDIETANVAAVWARLTSDPSPTLMYAASENRGQVTYVSSFQQQITLRGSSIRATRGLGWDLLVSWTDGVDPVASPTPPANWPSGITRHYEFPADSPRGTIMNFTCRFEAGDVSEIVILERRYRGLEISEYCSGPDGEFENLHFVDTSTGFVWRSLQWVGPKMDLIDLQILEPLD
ncbi:YjbF family lipoprotein [Amaricoccus tamworthensis]|uniref:YjbF family lipoprotein n=1 Tax=Amaricoccus tamworthensis TaxID=57002 RepID=UPI003C7D8911